MGGQSPGKLNCFIDKERSCDKTCKAFDENQCQLLQDSRNVVLSLKRAVRAWKALAGALSQRPVPKP